MSLRHVGIVTTKETFDDTVEFYKMFGFVFIHGKVEKGEHINNFFHMKGTEILTWKMRNEFDDCIELNIELCKTVVINALALSSKV